MKDGAWMRGAGLAAGLWLAAVLGVMTGCNSGATSPEAGAGGESGSATAVENGGENAPAATTQSAGGITLVNVDRAGYADVIDQHRGKVILVDFWATWCQPCRRDFKHTVELAQKYGDQGLSVISVVLDSTEESFRDEALEFLKSQNAAFTNLYNTDEYEQSLKTYEVGEGVPHYKVYGADGQVLETFGGTADSVYTTADIEAAVERALAQR